MGEGMYLTGFADEAAADIDGQIRATKALGWENIESRNIDGTNIHDISDDEFDVVYGRLQDAGVKINCFGSTIANWSRSIEQPFDACMASARRAIPRMQRLGARLIRIMSFAVLNGRSPEDQMAKVRFARVRELHTMFTGEGILPVHENCMNYGGMGWVYTMRLMENVPGLKLVFDTGNPVMTDDVAKDPPCPKQSSWDFYSHVKEHIEYVHIKDGRFVSENPDGIFSNAEFTFPGDGDGDVRRIVGDLVQRGYDGGISIEPHLAAVFHDDSVRSAEDVKFANYVEYGRRMMSMLKEVGAPYGARH